MRILAVILSYYPDIDQLKRNISTFKDQVSGIIIWENTPIIDREQYRIPNMPQIKYASGSKNSISDGLNYGWQYAKDNNYDYILSMDQDSEFINFDKYLDFCKKTFANELCIIGPWIDWAVKPNENPPYIERSNIITSGMMVPVQLLTIVGGYNSDFLVDAIDVDLSYKVRSYGYRTLSYKYASTQQHYGETYSKKVFGHIVSGPAYPPRRLFGIFRNHIIVYRRYGHPVELLGEIKRYIRIFIPSIVLGENHKVAKIAMIIAGIVSGTFSKIGHND